MTAPPARVDPHAFAAEWIAAWNAHDLDRILAHYAADVVLTSPRAAQVVPASGGVIRGRDALRAYWAAALARSPDLRFALERVLATVGGATLLYRNHRGEQVTETLLWNQAGQVHHAVVAYAAIPQAGLHCAIARVPAWGVAAFAAYEDAVLPLLASHGARLDARLRTSDGTTEIHLLVFPDAAALASFRADPRRAALQPQLAASGAIVELLPVAPA